MTLRAAEPLVATVSKSNVEQAVRVARNLERWGSAHDWGGTDPYDGLNATRVTRPLRGSPIALRLLTQAVKRSPVDLHPLLGIRRERSATTLAHAISAYARNGFLAEDVAQSKLRGCMRGLAAMRCDTYAEPCWGYHFDVQTRVFFYPRTCPNTIATAFAGLSLLDAHETRVEEGALELACGAGEFFLRRVPQTPTDRGAYFGYLPRDRTPIHNANMLVCAFLARLSACSGREDFRAAASLGLEYTVSRQGADGSWTYGAEPYLGWIDSFHTGYVLDALLTCLQAGIGDSHATEAWHRGLAFYVRSLIEDDGTPRYTPSSRYPIDALCAAQAIQTLSRAARLEPNMATRRWTVLSYALRALLRRDGAFVFQRERLWVNRTPHPRWVQAPMLAALAQLIASAQ